jgi:hypothetical protein
MTLALSLEHTPLVTQGAGSDQLMNDVHTIVYLVCLIVLLSKESCGKEYVNCHHAIITVVHLSVRHPPVCPSVHTIMCLVCRIVLLPKRVVVKSMVTATATLPLLIARPSVRHLCAFNHLWPDLAKYTKTLMVMYSHMSCAQMLLTGIHHCKDMHLTVGDGDT